MTIRSATRSLAPFALLALLAACDRPNGPPPPKAGPATAAGQAAPSTVALSGTILDPQPDPATVKPSRPAGRASASAGRAASGSSSDYGSGASGERSTQAGAEAQALRDFQAEQERRDRELLDQDMSEAQRRIRDESWERQRANAAGNETGTAPPRDWNDGREPYLPPEERGWSQSDELPPDEPPADDEFLDEPPYEEPPYEEEPPLDEGYDPRGGDYRP